MTDSRRSTTELAAAYFQRKLLRARRDPSEFIEFALRHEQTGALLRNAPFHREWQESCTEHNYLVLMAPVEHAKTNQLSIGRVLWEIGKNPNLRVAIISDTASQARKILYSIRQHIERNKLLHMVFPGLRRSERQGEAWNNEQLIVHREIISKDPTVQALGSFGALNGSRVDLTLIDDVCDFENTRTATQREKLVNWIDTTAIQRVTEGGRVWVVGTPWHREDALHVLSKRPGFEFKRYAAVLNPLAQQDQWVPLWPQQWSRKRLVERAENTTPTAFSRKFLTQVVDDSTSRFKQSWLARMCQLGEGLRFEPSLPNAQFPIFAGVDLAFGGDDLCAIVVLGLKGQQRIVLNIESGRWQASEILARIRRVYYSYPSPIIGVESNGAQKFVADMADVPVVPMVTTGKNKHDLQFGVESLAVEMRAGKWVLPSTGGVPEPEGAAWLQELAHYDPSGHTGDRVMASWIAREVSRLDASPFGASPVDLMR